MARPRVLAEIEAIDPREVLESLSAGEPPSWPKAPEKAASNAWGMGGWMEGCWKGGWKAVGRPKLALEGGWKAPSSFDFQLIAGKADLEWRSAYYYGRCRWTRFNARCI
jgi:hypothetical protein